MARVWVRKIVKNGNAYTVVLPVEVLRAYGWERGDYLVVQAATTRSLVITKYKPHELPGRLRAEAEELAIIHA